MKKSPSIKNLQVKTSLWLHALATQTLPARMRTAVMRLLRLGRMALKARHSRCQRSILAAIRLAMSAARRRILFFPKTYMTCLGLLSPINAFEARCLAAA